MKHIYKLVVGQGKLLTEALAELAPQIEQLIAEGFDDLYAIQVQQNGALFVVFKELILTDDGLPDRFRWEKTTTLDAVLA